jgi:hypothetical protein
MTCDLDLLHAFLSQLSEKNREMAGARGDWTRREGDLLAAMAAKDAKIQVRCVGCRGFVNS